MGFHSYVQDAGAMWEGVNLPIIYIERGRPRTDGKGRTDKDLTWTTVTIEESASELDPFLELKKRLNLIPGPSGY